MFTGWRVVHVGGYKCLLAGEWCMLVDINVYCMAGEWWHVGGYKCLLAGEWCMLVDINVYCMAGEWWHVGGYKCLLAGKWWHVGGYINVYWLASGGMLMLPLTSQ